MRTEVLDYIKTLDLGGFNLSTQAPYDENNQPLYIKNPKTVYVNFPQTDTDPFIQTLNGTTISNETKSISVYLSTDAKLIPSNYESVINRIKGAKDLTTIEGINRREVQVSTEYEDDLIVTTVELRYINIA